MHAQYFKLERSFGKFRAKFSGLPEEAELRKERYHHHHHFGCSEMERIFHLLLA
jgi:hypothetical protein